MFNDVATLINHTEEINELGEPIRIKSFREVFVKRLSVGQKEFYEAMAHGFKPEIKFELADYYDYEDEEYLIYNGRTYKVLRTYRKGLSTIELVCTSHVNQEEIGRG